MTDKDLFGDEPAKAANEYTRGFERWWKTYPAHRRREKVKCFEVWRSRKLEARADEVVSKLEADISFDPSWQPDHRGKQFIPLARTYLNGGRYDDDQPKPSRSAMPAAQDAPPAPDLAWQERLLNRLGLAYLRTAGGLPDMSEQDPLNNHLVRIKREILRVEVPALQEDIDAAGEDKIERRKAAAEASITMAKLFLSRLDAAYKLALRDRVMRISRRAA